MEPPTREEVIAQRCAATNGVSITARYIRKGALVQTVGAGAEEGEEAEVAEDLELLTDFGADVAIGGMQSRKLCFERISIREREFFLLE
jgi:hypothetical protein